MSIKKLLSEQTFYKQPIKKPRIKRLSNRELLREFYEKGYLEGMPKPIECKLLKIEI